MSWNAYNHCGTPPTGSRIDNASSEVGWTRNILSQGFISDSSFRLFVGRILEDYIEDELKSRYQRFSKSMFDYL